MGQAARKQVAVTGPEYLCDAADRDFDLPLDDDATLVTFVTVRLRGRFGAWCIALQKNLQGPACEVAPDLQQ